MRFLEPLRLLAIVGFATTACSQAAPPRSSVDGVEDPVALSAPGPLQGNWRVTRAGDPDDAALMTMQVRHDVRRLEGEYVLHQPFCGVEQRLPLPSNLDCEFTGLSAPFDQGRVEGQQARLILRPGADGMDHRIVFDITDVGQTMPGAYFAPGAETPVRIRLARIEE